MSSKVEDAFSSIIVPVAIDTAGFYVGNMLIDKVISSEAKVGFSKAIIFGGVDAYIRYRDNYSKQQSTNYDGWDNSFYNNGMIGLGSFVIAVLYDAAIGKNLTSSLKKNLIYNAVGVGTNVLVDQMILSTDLISGKYYR